MTRILLLFCLLLSVPGLAQRGFVRVQGQQFTLDGKPYRYIGANYWYGGLLATQGPAGKQRLRQELDFLKKQKVTNLRVMVGAEGLNDTYLYRVPQPLQPRQGEFNDSLLLGLDYLLAELGRRNMKAVLHFTNTWEWSGGLGQYLAWNGYGEGPLPKRAGWDWNQYQAYIAQFYTCAPCKAAVDVTIRHVLARTNALTGQRYVDDPAIMAWEIINEPRPMGAASTPAFAQWMQQTAALVKSLDANHLLTTGSEGDIASDNNMAVYEQLHADPNIDYATIHIWPKNWGWFKDTAVAQEFGQVRAKTDQFIARHVAVTTRLNKPLVIEEFGLPRNQQVFAPGSSTSLRDAYYADIFRNVRTQPGIAGCNFWSFGGAARPIAGQVFWKPGDAYLGDPAGEEQGLNSVFDSDKSTWKKVKSTAKKLN